MDVWFTTHLGEARLLSAILQTFFVIIHSFSWHDTSHGHSAIGFYLLAQDGTTGLDVVLHFIMCLLKMFIDALRSAYDGRLIYNRSWWCKVQFGAHFCVVMGSFNWHSASHGPSAIAELLFIFSYKIDWSRCGFFMSSCVCWGCLLMLCSSWPSVNRRRFTWFTWTVCVCWLNTLFHQIKGPCTIQES